MLGGGAVNIVVYSLLAWKFEHTPLGLAAYAAIGTLAGMSVNYLGMSRLIYRKHLKK